ncbi:hypothetical protein [Streptomyces triculaminicus]
MPMFAHLLRVAVAATDEVFGSACAGVDTQRRHGEHRAGGDAGAKG